MKKVLFITRKYPPQTGGMEDMSYNLSRFLNEEEIDLKTISLGKKQINLLWFYPFVCLYTIFNIRKYDSIIIGDALLCFLGILSNIFSKNTKRIIILYGLDITFKNKLYQLYLHFFLKGAADSYVCISNYTLELAEKWGLDKNLVIITPGINVQKFDNVQALPNDAFQKKYDIKNNDTILLTVGRLVKRKGVEWFIRNVLPKLENVTYIVVGDGEEKEKIKSAIKESDVEKKVRLLGRVSDEELNNIYFNSNIFIMPNIHIEGDAEGFGIVAGEASLAGLIVIASKIEGITSAIIDGKNGYLVNSGNTEEYVFKILETINDKFGAKEKFSNYTKEHYSWEYICSQYMKII